MSTHERYAICVENRGAEDLEVRKVYRVLPDNDAAASGYTRVIDESATPDDPRPNKPFRLTPGLALFSGAPTASFGTPMDAEGRYPSTEVATSRPRSSERSRATSE